MIFRMTPISFNIFNIFQNDRDGRRQSGDGLLGVSQLSLQHLLRSAVFHRDTALSVR